MRKRKKKKQSRPQSYKHAMRLANLETNEMIPCYADKQIHFELPRPISPELKKFYADEEAQANTDVLNISKRGNYGHKDESERHDRRLGQFAESPSFGFRNGKSLQSKRSKPEILRATFLQ